MKNGQFPAVFNLGDLNGQNGFKLDGENRGDLSGLSVDTAGDINGDGYADLVIGAYGYPGYADKGRSYVIFGGPGVGSGNSGIIALSSLNGANGFKLDGENNKDYSGWSVSKAGDVNGDSYADLLIGAFGYLGQSCTGRSYVILGGPSVGSGNNGIMALSSLNGANGFKLDGENKGDYSGWSVSTAGDVNDDGYVDLLIGAYRYSNFKGRSYVVFGGSKVGSSGTIALSSLTGSNGFKLDGENNADQSGASVSTAGDVNGDGVADLLVGAATYVNNTGGRSYVVFGGPAVGASGVLALSSLDGTNGFKLDGDADASGYSVSEAGDVNDDGVADLLVGAPYAAGAGRSYVVFGGSAVGGSGVLALSSLNGQNGFKLDGDAATGDGSGISVSAAGDVNGDSYDDIIVGATDKGRSYVVFGGPEVGNSGTIALSSLNGFNGFKLDGENSNDGSGHSVSTADDINGDGIKDLLIGAYGYPPNGRSYVVFGDIPPVLVNNTLNSLYPGDIVCLNNSHLAAYDLNHDNTTLRFFPTDVNHGQFQTVNNQVLVSNFTQQEISIGNIQFVHDGSDVAPSYNITVRSSGIAWTGPISANITFINFVLEANQLVINQGQTVILTANNLKAAYLGNVESDLIFLINGLTHGQFEFLSTPNQQILIFQQQNITDGLVLFVHDNSVNAPRYQVAVSNGIATSPAQDAVIDFDTVPILMNNELLINQGQSVHLNASVLNATHPEMSDDNHLRFEITALRQGQFNWISDPLNPITSFYQQNITDSLVEFVHDNSTLAPAYNVSVTDGRTISSVQAAIIDFDASPILLNNSLTINQGQTVALTSAFLSATHPGGDDRVLLFNISSVMHGKFSFTASPNQAILSFYQQNITDQLIQFSHDNSTQAPSYEVSVSDGRIWSSPQPVTIDFALIPILEINQLTLNQGQTIMFTADNLHATYDGIADPDLIFLISSMEHGHFAWVMIPGQSISEFQQSNVTTSQVCFVHDNSVNAPNYQVAVINGRTVSNPESARIDFDASPVLETNQLTIHQGETLTLTAENLRASHPGVTDDSTLRFLISNVSAGRFATVSDSSIPITEFEQANITQSQICFVHDNSFTSPAYQTTVSDGRITTTPQSAVVDFIPFLSLIGNRLTINQGQTVMFTSNNLNATADGTFDQTLVFLISETQHGYFTFLSDSLQPITNFQQQNITDGRVCFIHDDTPAAPSYAVSVSNLFLTTPPQAASIDFDAKPIIINNSLVITQGQTVVFTGNNLAANHPGDLNIGDLQFMIDEIQHGQFLWTTAPNQPISQFRQQNITDQLIHFVHDNSPTAPSYRIAVSDGRITLPPASAQIDFIIPITPKKEDAFTIIGTILGALAALAILGGGVWAWKRKKQTVTNIVKKEPSSFNEPLLSMQPIAEKISPDSGTHLLQLPSLITFEPFSPIKLLPEQPEINKKSQAFNTQRMDKTGDMKISFNIPYQDLEFDEKSQLGYGAYSTVYKGTYEYSEVAIKKLNTRHLSTDAVEELKREAGILGSVRSDYIVQLRGVCLEAPNYCLVMELMSKGSLYSVLQNSPELPLVVRLQIGLDVCCGLYLLHQKNILHRDLKSMNVLLDDRFRAKIADFGLSKIKSEMSSKSSSHGMKGTLGWMAPELFAEKPQVSAAVDIYALGMVMWEMITHPYRTPFQGLAPASLITAKLNRGENQEMIPKSCSPELRQWIRRCWQKPDKRPSAQVLAQSLSEMFKTRQQKLTSTQSKNIVIQRSNLLSVA